jgi:hypothetical protein
VLRTRSPEVYAGIGGRTPVDEDDDEPEPVRLRVRR